MGGILKMQGGSFILWCTKKTQDRNPEIYASNLILAILDNFLRQS